jgi:hypothetical protein
MLLRYFLNAFEKAPVAHFITGSISALSSSSSPPPLSSSSPKQLTI